MRHETILYLLDESYFVIASMLIESGYKDSFIEPRCIFKNIYCRFIFS